MLAKKIYIELVFIRQIQIICLIKWTHGLSVWSVGDPELEHLLLLLVVYEQSICAVYMTSLAIAINEIMKNL